MSNRSSASQAIAPKGSQAATRPPTPVVPAKAGTSKAESSFSAQRLLELYDRVAEAPDAVERLRKFVLDLAVRGKLVEQNDKEKPHHELLKLIPESDAEAFDATLASWRFPKIGEVLQFCYGKGLKKSERLEQGPVPVYGSNGIVGFTTEALTDSPAIIVGRKGSAGALNLCNGPSWTTDVAYFVEVPAFFESRYLFVSLQSLDLEKLTKGVKPGLSRADAYEVRLPIPPRAEQSRIIDRVNDLMALLDRLETTRTQRETTRNRLTTASLTRLTAPETTEADFPTHARFALHNLNQLTTRLEQIKVLRQTILNLAVRGKLIEQDAADEPATLMLERLAGQRARLQKTNCIPCQKPPAPDPSRYIHGLPQKWACVPLGEVIKFVTSGSRGWAKYYSDTGARFIRAQNIRFGYLVLENLAHVQPPPNSEGSRTQVFLGDLLIVITGAGVTNPAILKADIGEAYVSQHIGLVRPTDSKLSDWLLLCLMADCGGRGELEDCAYGAGRPGLNLHNIRSLTIPLPPLAEQHRIVAKVGALMSHCDRLEAALGNAETTRARLFQASLHEALGDRSSTQEAA